MLYRHDLGLGLGLSLSLGLSLGKISNNIDNNKNYEYIKLINITHYIFFYH